MAMSMKSRWAEKNEREMADKLGVVGTGGTILTYDQMVAVSKKRTGNHTVIKGKVLPPAKETPGVLALHRSMKGQVHLMYIYIFVCIRTHIYTGTCKHPHI
jgi:hypothetical protein